MPSPFVAVIRVFTKSSRQQKKKDIEAISYESVGGHGCSCLVTYGKYLGLAGFWKDERFLFAHHHTGNGFFYYLFYYREIMGSWFESISWGS